MHRHGYSGRKLSRQRDPRRALIKGLATSLIECQSIKTTLPKAKELVPYCEKLITKAKVGDLHQRRQIIAKLMTVQAAHKLVDTIAPQLSKRTSGHLRIEKLPHRRGDNAPMAQVSFVDELKAAIKQSAQPASPNRPAKSKPTATKKAAKVASKQPAKAKAKA